VLDHLDDECADVEQLGGHAGVGALAVKEPTDQLVGTPRAAADVADERGCLRGKLVEILPEQLGIPADQGEMAAQVVVERAHERVLGLVERSQSADELVVVELEAPSAERVVDRDPDLVAMEWLDHVRTRVRITRPFWV